LVLIANAIAWPAAALGLGADDDIDALYVADQARPTIYFSLKRGSAFLGGPFTEDDIFVQDGAIPAPGLAWDGQAGLGLNNVGNELNALDIKSLSGGIIIYFSLELGSPDLGAAVAWTADDVFRSFGTGAYWFQSDGGVTAGLVGGDDLDGLSIFRWEPATPTLTQWGLIILVVLLIGSTAFILHRKRKAAVPA